MAHTTQHQKTKQNNLIKNGQNTHTMEYYLAMKMTRNATRRMDLEGVLLHQLKLSQRKTNTVSYYLHVESKK